MKVTAYLNFNGRAEEAAGFYADALRGSIGNLYRYSDFPPCPEWEVPAGYGHKIGHCCVSFDGGSIGLADALPSDPRTLGDGGHMLTLSCDSAEQAEEAFARLGVGAQRIACPMQEVFYAPRYGELVDRFGVLWGVMFEK
ncbi:MAG: VOC family protein [Alistipes sp.]|jgi:PhnB protein|nr:VOC family protein [Alistipes sp.]